MLAKSSGARRNRDRRARPRDRDNPAIAHFQHNTQGRARSTRKVRTYGQMILILLVDRIAASSPRKYFQGNQL
jgi:hypothetical protein